MSGTATFNSTGRFRYTLTREWSPDFGESPFPKRCICWIMLNPSTADASVLDPTIRRCLTFSKRWDFSKLVVVNLFALRSTDPRVLRQTQNDVVGPENDVAIEQAAAQSERVIAAWGNHGSFRGRANRVLEVVGQHRLHHLGLTKTGQPRHPLYVASDTPAQRWNKKPCERCRGPRNYRVNGQLQVVCFSCASPTEFARANGWIKDRSNG